MVRIASRKHPLHDYLPHLHDDCMPSRYIAETRAFFGCRAATWDTKFGDDLPAYCAAVAEAGIRRGGVAIDVGCGTGRRGAAPVHRGHRMAADRLR